ncbi:sensor histidine kinase [Flavobacterium chuncheonense]|uniref:histidine kinase n=1 Tax=Flavobacterium chuncheonense TaxID=2026653 RepID=A0ABW5YHX4_9FLAO
MKKTTNRKFQFLIFTLFIATNVFAQFHISKALVNDLNDTLRPKDLNHVKLNELCSIMDATAVTLVEHNQEFLQLFNQLEKFDKSKLTREESISAYYTLMTFSRNNFEDLIPVVQYGDTLKNYIGNSIKGYERHIINYYAIKAAAYISGEKYSEAVYTCNEALNLYPKIKYKHFFINIYSCLGHLYKLTYQFDESNFYFNQAYKAVDKNSAYFKNYFIYAFPDLIVENTLLNYLQNSEDDRLLSQVEKALDENFSKELNPEWLSKWHLQKAYLNYFKGNLNLAQTEFEIADNIDYPKRKWDIIDANYKTLAVLLCLKNKEEAKAIQILENLPNGINTYFESVVYEKIYKHYKENNDFEKAYNYLENYTNSVTFENNHKYKGEILVAENKYKARENEIEIQNLKTEASIKNTRYQLQIALLIVLVLVVFTVLMYFNRQLKIKKLESEKQLQERNDFIQQSLKDAEQLIYKERTKIGVNIHNNLLSRNLVLQHKLKKQIATLKEENANPNLEFFEGLVREVEEIYEEARNFSHVLTNSKTEEVAQNLLKYLENIKVRLSESNLLNVSILMDEAVQNSIQSFDNKAISESLLPLIKETLSNTIKHTDSLNYTIAFEIKDQILQVDISNDGNPIKTKNKSKGIGLTSLKVQIEALSGKFETEKLPKGFKVKVRLPLAA